MTPSDPPPGSTRYRLQFRPEAWAEWNALDGSVKEVLRQQGYRLVYQVQDDVLVVLVLAVAKREDMAVYRAALQRLLSVE